MKHKIYDDDETVAIGQIWEDEESATYRSKENGLGLLLGATSTILLLLMPGIDGGGQTLRRSMSLDRKRLLLINVHSNEHKSVRMSI